MWEFFCDDSYYSMWAVKKTENGDFHSQELFHVGSKGEAMALSALLNGYELERDISKH